MKERENSTSQIQNIIDWNRQFHLGFSDIELRLIGSLPKVKELLLKRFVLAFYLDTPQATIEAYWRIITSLYPDSKDPDSFIFDTPHLQLCPGMSHERGIKWIGIEVPPLNKHEVVSPDVYYEKNMIGQARFVDYQALAFITQCPDYVQASCGGTAPGMWLPGYQVRQSPEEEFHQTLCVYCADGVIRMDAVNTDQVLKGIVIPELLI